MTTSDFAQRLVDKLIEQLKAGTAPWQQPWEAGKMLSPYNPTTGNRYRGFNILALMASDYADPRWMTYRQAQAQGWQVRAGEKGTQIQHWIWEEARTRLGKDGNPELDNEGKPIKELVRLSRPKVMVAAVFNAEQIDGVPALEPERTYDWDPVEQAEKLLRASEAKIEHSQTGGAYYRLATDTIRLPAQDRFEKPNAYYATALHELGHWTGHPDRLDRDLSNPFGSEGYAREELRAEIASMIIGSELGIGYDPVAHAGYVDHWVQILTDTPKEILYAAADAERISDYILTMEHKREISHTQEATAVKEQIPREERIYLAVPYEERDQAKAIGAKWDAVKKAWYVGPGVEPEKIAKWQVRHQETATLDPRAEFAVLETEYQQLRERLVDVVQKQFATGIGGDDREGYQAERDAIDQRMDAITARLDELSQAPQREVSHTQETTAVREEIPKAERTYLAVPYEERDQAKAIGARWDPFKKAWYVGPGIEPEKIAKWEVRHQETATLDPRAEFAEVLRSIGGIVEGEHPIMDGKGHRLATEKDKRGEAAIFYRAYLDGVANGYAENNRTKEARRWKARGQGLSEEQKSELLAEAEKKRYERRRQERERFKATAGRLSAELRSLPSGVEKTAYHEAKGIEPLPGVPVRNGDVLVPGYDVDGKVWTVQYIKEDGTKRFARESRKHGCFHVIGAANPAEGLQKLANSPVIAIAEGYATAATVAKYGHVPAIAAFDAGNLLAVATALHERWPDKGIMIAGDDDHKLENNPGRVKAIEAAAAVNGVAIFPQLSAEQREQGMTDFNDLGRAQPEVVSIQLVATANATREGRTIIRPIGFIGKDILALEKKITDPSEIIKQNQGFEISRLLNQQLEQEQHPGIDR